MVGYASIKFTLRHKNDIVCKPQGGNAHHWHLCATLSWLFVCRTGEPDSFHHTQAAEVKHIQRGMLPAMSMVM